MFTDVIILAGGYGERLWPASTSDCPKQFLKIIDGLSFLQRSLVRASLLLDGDTNHKIYIATRKGLESSVAKQCCELCKVLTGKDELQGFNIPKDAAATLAQKIANDTLIIAEPTSRHTTAPIALCVHLANLFSDEQHVFLVLTSDHVIEPFDAFSGDVERAHSLALQKYFVCFGIKADSPSTEYGYIQSGDKIPSGDRCFVIDKFHEKPDKQTAQKFLDSGKCFWNSGMFCFEGTFFLNELAKCTSEVATSFSSIEKSAIPHIDDLDGIPFVKEWVAMEAAYKSVPAIAVDKAIAEKTSRAAVVQATFQWDDIGSWDSFARHCTTQSSACSVDATGNFVYADIPVAICGIDDIEVIIKNGQALILKKGTSNRVRDIVKMLKEKPAPNNKTIQ